jgi:hypothetical protein
MAMLLVMTELANDDGFKDKPDDDDDADEDNDNNDM